MVTLYSTGCPRCAVLEKKLTGAGIAYEKCTSIDEMLALGLQSAPVLCVDGEFYDFSSAIDWLNQQKGEVVCKSN